MEVDNYHDAIVSTVKTYCCDKELFNCVCMTNITVILSMSPEP